MSIFSMHDAGNEWSAQKLYEVILALVESGQISTSRVLKAVNNITVDDDDESQTLLTLVIGKLKDSAGDPDGKGLNATREAHVEILDR